MKGWQLLKEIAEGNIKEGTKINIRTNDYMNFAVAILQYKEDALQHIEGNEIVTREFCSNKYDFEIIEEQEEINIQDIEEIKKENILNCTDLNYKFMAEKYNDLVKAIKQIDNKLKKEYCECCGVELDKNNKALNNMCNECKYGIDWEEK